MPNTARKLRLKIGILGKRNVGKSSIFNKLVRYDAAIVSPEPGTTTDPVKKAMEHHFLGPLLVIDTAGLDDVGILGEKRIERTAEVTQSVDIAVIVIEPGGWSEFEEDVLQKLDEKKIPTIIVINKTDHKPVEESEKQKLEETGKVVVKFSAKTGEGLQDLMDSIAKCTPTYWLESRPIVRDLYPEKELMVLVTPSYKHLPPARIPMSHNRIIRDALDNNAGCSVTNEKRLGKLLSFLAKPPKLVVTDFSVYDDIAPLIPKDIPLTTTAIIFNRFQGELMPFFQGASSIKKLEKGDKILLVDLTQKKSETIAPLMNKAENAILNHTGKDLNFHHCGRRDYPEDTSEFKLVVIYGEAEISGKKTLEKIDATVKSDTPITNLDILSVYIDKSKERIVKPFVSKYPQLTEI